MNLYKLLLIASLTVVPSCAWAGSAWADEAPQALPEAAADAAVDEAAADPLVTGTVDPAATGEAEEVWMSPAESYAGGGCHRDKAKTTVYYTN